MRVLLDSIEIEPPNGLDGLVLTKSRHPRYWGFLLNRVGYAPAQLGDIEFRDAQAIRLILDAFERDGVNAETKFEIQDDSGAVIYSAYIDYVRLQDGIDYVSCSFRDENSVQAFDTNLSTVYAIPATETITLPGQPLAEEATYILNSSTVSRTSLGPVLHSLPLKRADEKSQPVEGELLSVLMPFSMTAIYENRTDKPQTLKLSGPVVLNAVASTSVTARFGYRLMNGDKVFSDTVLGQISVSATETSQTLVVDAVITVPVNYSLVLGWISATGNVDTMTFSYQPATAIALTSVVNVPETDCNGLFVASLFKALLGRIQPEMSLESEFFQSGVGSGAFITNEANLRGINRPLKVSFSDLFDGLDAIWNLAMMLADNVLRIEQKAVQIPDSGITILPEISSVLYQVNTDFLFNSVQFGYQTWRGDGITSNAEVNGSRSYRTGITTFRNEGDFRSGLIASGSMIEEARRKQFDSETAGSEKAGNDDRLFIVMVGPDGRAKATPFYNSLLSPAYCAQNWFSMISYCRSLELETYEGITGNREPERYDLTGVTPLVGQQIADITAPMTMQDFSFLTNWVRFYDGRTTRIGLVLDAQWSKGNQGDTVTLKLAC